MRFRYRITLFFPLVFLVLSLFSEIKAADIKIGYGWSINPAESEAVQEAVEMMSKTVDRPDLVILLVESSYEKDDLIARDLYNLTHGARIFGLEGSYAVFSNDGIHVGEKGSLAVLGIKAPEWRIGVSIRDMAEAKTPMQIKEMAIDAIKEAYVQARSSSH